MKDKQYNSLISLDLIGLIISDLNSEFAYKASENSVLSLDYKAFSLNSDGDNHCIIFCGDILWSSELEKNFEQIPIREELDLNEREPFEKHLRLLANDKLKQFNNLKM